IVCDGKRVQGVLTMSDLLKLSTALQNQSKEAEYHLISSSKRTIKRIVEEVEQVHAAVQVREHKSDTMVDMPLEGKSVLQKLTDTVAIISSNAKQQQTQM